MVDRYVLLGTLGAGGMGVVYAAHDPELDRNIALKLVSPRANDHSGEGKTRLFREAQALAKLSHPNVVTVHDVGTHDEQVWIAMEFVVGQTLGAWAAERPRPWTEVVQVLASTAHGVAAAHAAGLVHRDLKPDNVMIGRDGRVRVMDFGLAHGRNSPATEPEIAPSAAFDSTGSGDPALNTTIGADAEVQRGLAALALRLTRAGALQGTPAYMAPEQWQGLEAEAAADQFGWSVMAWELLYGERPFAGDTVMALATAVLSGQRRAPRGGKHVPGWLRRAIERGLATDPAQRWPTMAALLSVLERGRTRARVRMAAMVVAGVALLGAGAEGFRRWDVAQRVAVCQATGAEIDEAWNDEARQRLREAITATGVSYAEGTADKVMPWLDERARAWKQGQTEVCLNADVRGVWSEDLLDRATWCLEDRRMDLESLVAELGRANGPTMQKAVAAVAGLKPVDACLDAGKLQRQPALPTQRGEALRDVRAQISRAQSLSLAGNHKEALIVVTQAREQATAALDWLPLLATARALEGRMLEKNGLYEESEAASEEAYFEAAHSGAWDVAARAATDLIFNVGSRQARYGDGRAWAKHAAVALAYAGDPAGVGEAQRLNNLAAVDLATGANAEALASYERALTIAEQVLGPGHPNVAIALNNIAGVHMATGAHAEARALYERALVIKEQVLGTGHPEVATGLSNLAAVHEHMGAHATARALSERALAIREQALGPNHPEVAASLNNLAVALESMGAPAEARALHERALAINEKALRPDHPDIAMNLGNLAKMHFAENRPQEALTMLERALPIYDAQEGAQAGESRAYFDHARVLIATNGDRDRALGLARKARDGFREAGEGEAKELAEVEKWLAEVE